MLKPEQIIFCDNHLLALDKPGGLLCQPSGTEETSLEDLGKAWLKERFQKPGNVFLEAVHRIDRPVSGIVLFARTSKALSRLNASQRAGQWRKTYQAWVSGDMPEDSGALVSWLIHDDFCSRAVAPATPGAKEAQLTYRVLKRESGHTLLEVQLLTGRYHQIRAQLAEAGCPILGDAKYGSCEIWQTGRGNIALRHCRLEFPHPVTREPIVLDAPWN